MRQIKFRGKNSKDEWVYGSLIINETENEKGKFQVAFIVPGLPCASDGGDFYTARMERVKIETIGQYTGLHDNKGNEIYEGDIVKKHDPYNVYTSDYTGEVIWGKGRWKVPNFSFGYWTESDLYFDDFAGHKQKVIGNIYDNPELIPKR